MPYGTIKVDNITFDNGGTDKLLTVSGLFFSTSGALTVTGTIAGGNVTAPTATFTTLTGTTTAGTTATFTSGSFTSLTGVTTTVTSGIFGAGTAAAPSIVFSGDSNTGIYSPGADQVAISTSGTGRITVDASGRLLVGTSAARSNFFGTTLSAVTQTEGTGGAIGRGSLSVINNDVSNNPPYVLLGRSGAATLGSNATVISGSRLGTLTFHGADGTSFIEAATVAGEVDGTPGASDMPGRLVFSTTADGAPSPTERLRIDSSGRVGIGTSSPSSLLTLFSTTASDASEPSLTFGNNTFATQNPACVKTANAGLALEVQSPSTGTFQNRGRLRIDGGSSTFVAFSFSSDNGSNYTERLRVTSAGNVGIGTISPTYQLELSTDSAGKPSTNTWTIVSDERIKEDIELADLSLCYQAVKGIPLKRYKWKDTVYTEEQVHDRHKLGWISQDVKAVFPKAVRISEFKYNQVFSETVIPAVDEELDENGNVVISAEPERIEKELVSEDIIEDCHDLNADQLYAAMYGAVQMLMIKVEALEAHVASFL